MNHPSFDRLARVLGGAATRREGLVAVLAGVLGLAVPAGSMDAAGDGSGEGPNDEPGCRTGTSGKKQRCRTHADCCTGYCKRTRKRRNGGKRAVRRCRCAPEGFACGAKTICCGGMTCATGRCGTPPNPACTSDSDCGGDTPYCTNGACVACMSDSDCGGCTPYCSRQTGACTAAWTNLTTFGSSGSGRSQFTGPVGVTISADGLTTWVADTGNDRISVWTRPGTTGADATDWGNQTTFGSRGSGASQFNNPASMVVSADGLTAWVADSGNDRIPVWTRPGTTGAGSTDWSNLTAFGSNGSGASQFSNPGHVFLSADGLTAWVADTGNSRISVWTRPGAGSVAWSNQTTFGDSYGSGPSQFAGPTGVVASLDGLTAWVADFHNYRISVWTRPGTTGGDATAWGNQTTFGDSYGPGPNQFAGPVSVAVSADGLTVWVADSANNRISVWTRPGTTGADATDWSNQTTFGSRGSGASQFYNPAGVAVSADGLTAWVADAWNDRVSVWTAPLHCTS